MSYYVFAKSGEKVAWDAESIPLAPLKKQPVWKVSGPDVMSGLENFKRAVDFLKATSELPVIDAEASVTKTRKRRRPRWMRKRRAVRRQVVVQDSIPITPNSFGVLEIEPCINDVDEEWGDAPKPKKVVEKTTCRECSEEHYCLACGKCFNHASVKKCCSPDQPEIIVERKRRVRVCRGFGAFYRRCLRKSEEQLAAKYGDVVRRRLNKPLPYGVAVRLRLSRKLMSRKMIGHAQALFGVDLNLGGEKIDVEHLLRIPVVEKLIGMCTAANEKVNWIKLITESIFFFMHLCEGGLTTRNLLLCGSHFMSAVGFTTMTNLFCSISKRAVPNAQSGNASMAVLGTAIAGIISVVSVLLFSMLPSDKNVDVFIQRFSRIGHCITSASKIGEFSGLMSDSVIEFIQVHFLGVSPSDLKEFSDVDMFCDEVQAINTVDLVKRCDEDVSNQLRSKVTSWLQRADALRQRLDALKISPSMTTRFQSTCLFLYKVRDMLDNTPSGVQKSRIAPLTIHIHGVTGVGKSSALDYLNTHLLIALGSTDPADLVNKVFYRNPMSEFWDGFRNGTQIVVCDDFGSVRDSVARPSPEGIDVIRMGNTAPFKPVMADLSGKAMAMFDAPVVIWTSNRCNFNFPSMTNPEAVANRVHLRFRQIPHPDFAISKNLNGMAVITLDSEKVSQVATEDPEIFRKCMLFVQESTEGLPTGLAGGYPAISKPLTFEQMKDVCVNSLLNKQNLGYAIQQDRVNYFTSVLDTKTDSACVVNGDAQAGDAGDVEDINKHRTIFFEPPGCQPNVLPETERWNGESLGAYANVSFVEAEILRGAGMVDENSPMACFVQPSFLKRMMGGHTHIDVMGTLVANGYRPRHIAALSAMERDDFPDHIREFYTYRCLYVAPGMERMTVRFILAAYKLLSEGAESVITHFDMRFNQEFPIIGVCPDHENHSAQKTIQQRILRCLKEAAKTPLLHMVRQEILIGLKNPLIGALIALTKMALFVFVVRQVCRWLMTKVFEMCSFTKDKIIDGWKSVSTLFGDTEKYTSAGVVAAPSGRVEQYPNGSVRSGPAGAVEAYPNGVSTSKPTGRIEGVAESLSDQNADEIRRKLAKNMYHIWTRRDGGPWFAIGSLTVVRGRLAITNRHIYDAMFDDVKIQCSVLSRLDYVFKKSDLNMTYVPDDHPLFGQRDVCLVELPVNVSIHGDITGFFMKSSDFSLHSEPKRVCLMKYTAIGGQSVMHYQETDVCKAIDSVEFGLRVDANTERHVRRFYAYALETSGGDCGGMVVAFDPRFNRKICAMHMAGMTNQPNYTGAAVAVSQELIKELRSQLVLNHNHSDLNGEIEAVIPAPVMAVDGRIVFSGVVMDGLNMHGNAHAPVYTSPVTAIRPSVVADICGPILKKPAYLRKCKNLDGQTVDPLSVAMVKVSTPSLLMPTVKLAAAEKQVRELIVDGQREDVNTLTFDTAIKGIEGKPEYPAINRSTSPGYGWVKKGKGKTHYLGDGEFVVSDEVVARYSELHEQLKNGKRCGQLWTDTLKDEIRPIDKVEQGKTRLFSAGEMVQTILLRQYFMGFNAHMAKNCVKFESCVGVNPYSMDWTVIADKLQKHGSRVVAGDFANYDGTLPADGLWAVLRVVNAFYAQNPAEVENNKIRELLWLEIVNSVHIQGSTIYSWTHSQPSGCPFTSILNSVFHSIAVRVAYLIAAEKHAPEQATLAVFARNVEHVNYGDDDVTNVSSTVSWFNQITMAEAYATFGMTYTDEGKTGELVEFRRLDQIQFLKRSFIWDASQARYFAPLDLATIREMPCWNKTKGDSYSLTALVLEDAVYELAQHPREVYDSEIVNLERAAAYIRQRVAVYLPTFDEVRAVDGFKYTLPGCISSVHLKPCDRGDLMTAESQVAANPAVVSKHLERGNAETVGELFSSSDECVPTQNNRLFIQPTQGQRESADQLVQRLNNFTKFLREMNLQPTMCDSSAKYKDPCTLDYYRVVKNCPCDFHGRVDIEMLKSAREKFAQFSGDAQSGHPVMYACPDAMAAMQPEWRKYYLSQNYHCDDGPICDWHSGNDKAIIMELSKTIWYGHAQSDVEPKFAGVPTEEVHEVMTFSHDGEIEEAQRVPTESTPNYLVAPTDDKLVNDIIGFLSRPVHLKDLVWSVGQPAGTELATASLPRDWILTPMIFQKLEGFRYVKCTLVIEIQMNAQPMNAGALIAAFIPLREQLTSPMSSEAHFGGLMGYPHVIYRCDQATSMKLKIPFFPLLAAFDLVNGYGAMGTMTTRVMSPLTGTDNVDGTVFIWAEDITVSMPTGLPVYRGPAQAGAGAERRRPGNIETAAATLGGVTSALSNLPVIGDFAKTGSMVLGGVGKIASLFGWSKPTDPEYVTSVAPSLGRHMMNYNGDAKPKVLALDAQNTVNISTEAFNSTEDEMAFSTLLKRPVYTDRFTMDGTQPQGTLLFRWPVDATSCRKSRRVLPGLPPITVVDRQETYLSYLSTCARLWRGGIRYHFMIVKNNFHSGRLRFTYVPGAIHGTNPSTIDFNKCYSEVHDLRSTSDVTIDIPFNYLQPWKEVGTAKGDDITTAISTVVPQGMLYVTIVNALRNPPTVESTIDIMMMTSALPDFQFAIPQNDEDLRIWSRADRAPSATFGGVAQAGGIFTVATTELESNASTIGEAFTGFREWLKRYTKFGVAIGVSDLHVFRCQNGATTVDGDIARRVDPFYKAAVLYRFMSGSIRVLAKRDGEAYTVSSIADSYTGNSSAPFANGNALGETTKLEPIMEYEIPYYQKFPALMTDSGTPLNSEPERPTSFLPYTSLPHNNGTTFNMMPAVQQEDKIYRAIGEDFSFGYALGVPLTFVRYI